jgi:hypothetical protein
MSAEWKDITSHSQDSTAKTPRMFELVAGDVLIVVTRMVGRNGWFLRAYQLGIDVHELIASNLEDAQREAVDIVDNALSKQIRRMILARDELP